MTEPEHISSVIERTMPLDPNRSVQSFRLELAAILETFRGGLAYLASESVYLRQDEKRDLGSIVDLSYCLINSLRENDETE